MPNRPRLSSQPTISSPSPGSSSGVMIRKCLRFWRSCGAFRKPGGSGVNSVGRMAPGSQASLSRLSRSFLTSRLTALAYAAAAGPLFVGFRLRHNLHAAAHLPHHVVRAEDIWNPQLAFRVVAPCSVHQKPVMVGSRRQPHGRLPNPIRLLHQVDGLALPVRKVTHQLNAVSLRSSEKEFLNRLRFVCLRHKISFMLSLPLP